MLKRQKSCVSIAHLLGPNSSLTLPEFGFCWLSPFTTEVRPHKIWSSTCLENKKRLRICAQKGEKCECPQQAKEIRSLEFLSSTKAVFTAVAQKDGADLTGCHHAEKSKLWNNQTRHRRSLFHQSRSDIHYKGPDPSNIFTETPLLGACLLLVAANVEPPASLGPPLVHLEDKTRRLALRV